MDCCRSISSRAVRGRGSACMAGSCSGGGVLAHAGTRPDRDRVVAGDQLQFAILDQALQPHAALAQRGELVHGGLVDVEHGQVFIARERGADLVPPDVGGAPAVVEHHHLLRTAAGLAEARLVRLAELDPLLHLAGVRAPPQGGLVLVAEALAELQPLVGVQREGEQAHHQPFLGFRRMAGEGECVSGVVVPVHVADRQFGLVDGGVEGHGGAWLQCNRSLYAPAPWRPALSSSPMIHADAPSTVHLPKGDWPTALDGLCACFPRIPREQWLDRVRRGRVLDAQGAPIDERTPHRAGMKLRYFREVASEPTVPGQEVVLHADEHLVVVDKPHFLPVIPAGAYVRQTLLARLIHRLGNPALVPLHRLDRETAGLVLFSAQPATRDAYLGLFRARRIAKRYEALAAPLPSLDFPHVRRSRLERGEPFFRMCEVDGEAN